MKTYKGLWGRLCSFDNIFLAYKKARKKKTKKLYIIEFEKNLIPNLLNLQSELQNSTYQPRPLMHFTIRDPKTRKISKSDFRDRIVHHALCNIIEPIFDKTFIYDSYANRIGKGTLKAIQRFDYFKRKASKNNSRACYVLKADIRHYFENVDHGILISLIRKKIADENIIFLVKKILTNYDLNSSNKGMPLGNLTSQFFANIYLNEFDHYIKENLRIRHYIRYVDDFVILSDSEKNIEEYKSRIDSFLSKKLALELHPEKTRIITLNSGAAFLGIRVFYNHKLLKKSNIRKFKNKLLILCAQFDSQQADYDKIYDSVEGWIAYSRIVDSFNLRNELLPSLLKRFDGMVSTKEYNRYLKMESAFALYL